MNVNTGATQDLKIAPPLKDPQIGILSDTQIVLVGKGNKICTYNSISDKTMWFCDDMTGDGFRIQVHNLNLILMSDRELRVYNPEKNKLLQDFGKIVDPSARYTAIGSKKYEVIIAYNPNPSNRKHSKTLLKILKEAPIDQQITRFLKLGEDKEAERIFYIENKGKPNIEDLKREFDLNTGWIKFFERLDFENAVIHLINGKIDPRELMFFFGYHNYCSELRECLSKPPRVSIEDCIDNYMITNKEKINTKTAVKMAKEALLNILSNCYREYSQEFQKKVVRFNSSSFSNTWQYIKEDRKEIGVQDLVSLLATVNVFLLSDLEFNVELEAFIKRADTYDKDEVIIYLQKKDNKEPLAIFYEGIGEVTKALEVWKDIRGDRGIFKTIKILSNINLSKGDLFKYCKWVLREKPEQVIQILISYDKTMLHPDDVIEFLRGCDSEQPLVLKYLKSFIDKRNDTSKSLHTTLAFEYINQIYQIKQPTKGYNDKCDDEETLAVNRENFKNFLNESSYYDVTMVLNKINNSWMMEETILLLVKGNQHSKALETYLDKGMDTEAENFCVSMPADLNLITTLFEIYMKRYSEWNEKCETIKIQNKSSKDFGTANSHKQRYEQSSMSILKKYACHASLDAERVLKAFPDDWRLSSSRTYDLMKYLTIVFDHKLTLQENSNIGEGLSSMEHINMEHKLANKKKAFVKITSDYICTICKSRLDIDKLFVYPNGQVVHKHCGKNDSEKGLMNVPIL